MSTVLKGFEMCVSLVSSRQHYRSHDDNSTPGQKKDSQQGCFTGLKTDLSVTLKTRENTVGVS